MDDDRSGSGPMADWRGGIVDERERGVVRDIGQKSALCRASVGTGMMPVNGRQGWTDLTGARVVLRTVGTTYSLGGGGFYIL
jgi:hypothetical protein